MEIKHFLSKIPLFRQSQNKKTPDYVLDRIELNGYFTDICMLNMSSRWNSNCMVESKEIVMHGKHPSRLRLEICIITLLDIHEFLESKGIHPQISIQFEKLKKSVSLLDASLIREADLQKIEDATNRLLQELSFAFNEDEAGALYESEIHH